MYYLTGRESCIIEYIFNYIHHTNIFIAKGLFLTLSFIHNSYSVSTWMLSKRKIPCGKTRTYTKLWHQFHQIPAAKINYQSF